MTKTPIKQPPHADEFEPVITALSQARDVESTRKFATMNLTVGGKVFAFTNKGGMVVKLPASRVAALVAAGKAKPLVMGKRTMKEWAVLQPGKGPWLAVALEAKAFVGGDQT